jgi:hypothetical protein
MVDPSLEVRGALFHFLRERSDSSRVDTPFTAEEIFPFITNYFEDCLGTPDELTDGSKWILQSIDLTHAIAYWANDFWKARSSKERARLMSWLRSVLLDFRQHRELLATALTDHLLSQAQVRRGFTVWASDPNLAPLFPELGEVKAT